MLVLRRLPLLIGLVAAFLLTACQNATEPVPEAAREVPQYPIGDFLATVSFGGGAFAEDNSKLLVHSDATGVFNAYAYPVDGSEPTQLTFSETDSLFVNGYFADGERFLYSSDQGGNELTHLYVCEPRDDGPCEGRDLTPGDNLKSLFYGWSQDGTAFFVGTNERDPKFFDLYEYRADNYEREMIYKNEDGYFVSTISNDKERISLVKTNTNVDSDVFVYERASGETRHITPHEGDASFGASSFTPDSRSLLLTTDEGSDFRYLLRHDLENGERQVLEQPDWDVLYASYSRQGNYLVVGINQDAKTVLKLYDAASMTPVELPQLPEAEIRSVRFSNDESQMSLYASSGRMPSDLFVTPIGGEARQLTRSLSPEIAPEDLIEGEVVRFASFDGEKIPGILYKPHQATPEAKAPALVWVHGGPGGQSRLGYRALIQYLVNHGYVIYAINNRGSSGYGKRFFHLDDRAHGKGDLDDCVASKQMLADTGYVDPERIGIMGGSYGGYMVLAALAFRPEEFELGVDIFGVSNWVRTLASIPPWWEAQRRLLEAEIGDFDDEEYLSSISPLFHAEKIVRPLIVLQGANDPRVVQVESDEIVEKVRANGVPVEYVIFEDEGHGFRKKENQEEAYEAILGFLEEHLSGPPEVERQKAVG